MCLQARFTKETQNKCSAPARTPVNRSIFRRLCEFVWGGGCVTAPAAWASGPSTLASRGPSDRRRRGTRGLPGRARGRGDAGVYTDRRKRPLGVVSGHLCTLLHPRAVSGGTSASTAMVCRRRPLGGRLSLRWENGLCASTAAARLASSPRQQPTQTPDFGHIRTPATSSDVPGPSRPLRMPSQATSDRSSQHKREVHPGQRLGGPGLPAAPARVRPSRPFHHGAEAALRLRVCHILPCFTPVRARGRRCACPGPRAREATPTHPSA